ncbi:MAG: DUF2079 domain-containing protein, partial [Dehalococcoidia bacterium]|nr:DUF2079 domain-containing protein [Dehalococcoidia bacterium]
GPLAIPFDPARFAPEPRRDVIAAAIAWIPKDASLMAQTDLAPHVAHRRVLYMFPDAPRWGAADYVLLDLRGNKYPLTNPEEDYDRAIQQYFLSPEFETVFDHEDIVVLRRRAVPLAPATPLSVNFARRVGIEGYTLETPTIAAGRPVTLTLWWTTLLRPTEDYVMFVHVLDDDGKLVAQLDVMPTEDWFPTSLWDTGRRFRVSYVIPTPDSLAAGSYRLVVGLYGANTQRRAPVVSSPGDTSVTLPDRLVVFPSTSR